MRHLMTAYDPAVRPAEISALPLNVTFGVSLHHIIDVDEKNQILTTNCWITQKWVDHHLKWNASDFDEIKVIRIPHGRVWKPDIILYNNADPQYQSSVINTNVIVSNTGEVVWLSHGIYRSSCEINVEYFPFDLQSCSMKWASWTYDGYQVELAKQTEEGDVSNYQANGEFDLVSFHAVKNVANYSCCVEPYPDITYTIKLKRRPMFYVFNLILPCILINCIALLVFYVPSDSGEKVTLGISALLSMTVFLMTIRETLPPTEKTPLISLYYGTSICLVTFASGLSVVTLNIYHRGVRGTPVPKVFKSLILERIGRLIFMQFDTINPHKNTKCQEINPQTGTRLDTHWPWQEKSPKEDGYYLQNRQQRSPRFLPRHKSENPGDIFESQIIRMLNKVHESIERNDIRLIEQERRELTELEWKQMSIVLDRLLLVIFVLITIVSTTTILCRSPGPEPPPTTTSYVNRHKSLINRINNFCTTSKHLFGTHYDVLNLKRDCTTKEVKDAFIKLSKQYHPDTANSKESQQKFIRVLEAYNVLSKPNLRRSYDLGLVRPKNVVKTNSPNQYYEYDPHYERVVKDQSFWEHRDKSQDEFYQNRSYYGIKGIPRVSNKIIVVVCMVFAAIGVALQVTLISSAYAIDRKSLTFKREHMLQKSMEAEEAFKQAKSDAMKYGNEVQLRRLKERFERNNLMPKEQ
ncbi:putative neurotransmitter-gated ion-channel transmembrane region [Trypoxylus dichotomus]